jgi:hypothetical protein
MPAPNVYNYHHITFEYTNTSIAKLDPLETVHSGVDTYLLPANATFEEIPTYTTNQIPIFDITTNTWSVVEDYRNIPVWDGDGNPVTITELGPLPSGYTTTEPPIDYLKLRSDLENDIKEYRKSLSYGGVYINNVRFGTDLTDFTWLESALSWYPKHWNDNPINTDIDTLTIDTTSRGYFNSPIPIDVTVGCLVTLGPPKHFIVDTVSTETTSGTGHFALSIENYIKVNSEILVDTETITISNISDTTGTTIGSVEFTEGTSLTIGTHTIYPNIQFPEYRVKIVALENDGTNTNDVTVEGISTSDIILKSINTMLYPSDAEILTYITNKLYYNVVNDTHQEVNIVDIVNILGTNYVREIYTEPFLNWQITTDDEMGFYSLQVDEITLRTVHDIIADFKEACFDAQATKRDELYNTSDAELVNFDVTTGWPSREFTV